MSITKLIAELTKLEDIAGDAPDINILNYDDDQIVAVNSALNDVYNGISQIKLSIANMVLVPREPTDEMINNGCIALAGSIGGYEAGCVDKCYNAMLSIAEEAE